MYGQFYNPLNAYRVDKAQIALTKCIYKFIIPKKNGSIVIKNNRFKNLHLYIIV